MTTAVTYRQRRRRRRRRWSISSLSAGMDLVFGGLLLLLSSSIVHHAAAGLVLPHDVLRRSRHNGGGGSGGGRIRTSQELLLRVSTSSLIVLCASDVSNNNNNAVNSNHHDTAIKVITEQNDKDDSKNNACPMFSRSYPRYRIDLTSYREEKKQWRWPWQIAMSRYQLEQQHSTTTTTTDTTCTTTLQWAEDVTDGVSAVTILWKMAAEVSRRILLRYDDPSNLTATTTTATSSMTTAFPHLTNRKVIRQWVDLIEWLLRLEEKEKDNDDDFATPPNGDRRNATTTTTMSVSFVMDPIPAVTLTVDATTPANQSLPEAVAVVQKPRPATNSSCSSGGGGDTTKSDFSQNILPDHETVTARTKAWVKRVLVQLTICPFTKSTVVAGQGLADVGVPLGKIAYHTSYAQTTTTATTAAAATPTTTSLCFLRGMCQLQADVWEAIRAMLAAGPDVQKSNGIGSILLAAPAFDENFPLWSGPVFALLEAGVMAASATDKIGVVCFHPLYQTPSGSSFPGFGHMHSVPRLQQWLTNYIEQQQHQQQQQQAEIGNELPATAAECPVTMEQVAAAGGAWQRRTPHATINVLRADQLAAAEGKRSTPTLYAQNILRLQQVGWDKLQESLDRERNLEL